MPNPCNTSEKCTSFGNIAYKCDKSSNAEPTTATVPPQTTKYTTRYQPTTTTKTETKKAVLKNENIDSKCKNLSNDDTCEYYASQKLCQGNYFLEGEQISIRCAKSCNKCSD